MATPSQYVTDPANTVEAIKSAQAARKKQRGIPLVAKILIGVVAFVGIVGIALALYVGSLGSAMKLDDATMSQLSSVLAPPADDKQAFYALIIGSDAREGETASRSDVIMLTRVDPTEGKITLVSIPRDTMVTGTMGLEKINAEYNYGPAATVKAVSELAGVDISHYVEVNFKGLEEIVDDLGGITVSIPENITTVDGVQLSKGEQTLNGEQALAFARERKNATGGDFGRAQAQRQVVQAIVSKVVSAPPMEVPGLVQTLAGCVKTDMSIQTIVDYTYEFQEADETKLMQGVLPSYAFNQDGVSYVGTMYNEWRQMMQRVDAGEDPLDTNAVIPDEQKNNERLGAATNSASPQDYQSLAANSLTSDMTAQVTQ